MRFAIDIVFSVAVASLVAHAQARPFPGPDVQQIYQRLLPQIEKIPAFDHHAHPGFADDPDVDAMAAPPNASAALRTRDDNPELVAAAKALFGYPYDDLSPEHCEVAGREKDGTEEATAGHCLFQLDPRQDQHREFGGKPRHDGRLPRSQALSVGVFRRFLHVAVQQRARDARAIPMKAFTFRCRKRCCTAGCSRKMSANFRPALPTI